MNKKIIGLSIFLLPSIYIFRYVLFNNNEIVYSIVFLFGITLVLINEFIKGIIKNKINIKTTLLFYLFTIGYLFTSMIWLKYHYMILSGISLIMIFLAVIIISDIIIRNNLSIFFYQFYVYGILFISLLFSFLTFVAPNSFKLIDNRFGWFWVKGQTVSDPNLFGVFIALALGYLLLPSTTIRGKNKWLNILIFLILLYFLVATLSRGALVAFLISLFFFVLVKYIKTVKTYMIFSIMMIFIVVIAIFFLKNASSDISNINYLSLDRYLLLTTSERVILWKSILLNFFNEDIFTILFGHGFQSGSVIGALYYFGIESSPENLILKNPHNMYLQFLIEVGLVGIVLLIINLFIYMVSVINSYKNKNYIPIYFFILFIASNISLNIMGFRELYLVFGTLIILSIRSELTNSIGGKVDGI